MPKTILVLGASGFLGSGLASSLAGAGLKVRLFSRRGCQSPNRGDFESVSGDVFDPASLEKALTGVSGVTVALPWHLEKLGVTALISALKSSGRTDVHVTYTSGLTAVETNRKYPLAKEKLDTEALLRSSGLNYTIFRPGWFFESVSLFIRDGKSSIFGRHDRPLPFLSLKDYGALVASAYGRSDFNGKTVLVPGKEKLSIQNVLERYTQTVLPGQKPSVLSFGFGAVLGFFTGSKELKAVVALLKYFTEVKSFSVPGPGLLGADCTSYLTCGEWLSLVKSEKTYG